MAEETTNDEILRVMRANFTKVFEETVAIRNNHDVVMDELSPTYTNVGEVLKALAELTAEVKKLRSEVTTMRSAALASREQAGK